MNLLLDTHLYIWWLKADSNLSKKACALITEAEQVYVSSVSIWEATIKIQLGKLEACPMILASSIVSEGFIELPLTASHTLEILKIANHHRDPFDRILIAQAISHPLRFLTSDTKLRAYSELVEIV